jgi:raffinose/stachyose/melibiose transport system permease protein
LATPDVQERSGGAADVASVPRTPDPGTRRKALIALAVFLGPALAFYVLFLIIPLTGTVILSFTDWPGFNISQLEWAGLDNFRELAGDPVFRQALVHNVVLLIGAIVLKTVVALVLALALDQRLPLSNFFRGVYLMPTILSLVVVALVFSLALSPSLGIVNPFLESIGLGGLAGEWLGDPGRVLPMIVLIDAWGGFGLFMFLFIARLMAVPQDLRDAAAVDGAGELQTIRHVIIPQLRSTISMVVLLAAIQSLKMFELIYVMTSGGPNHASEVLATWGYFQGFTASRVGYGSAILVVLLVITFLLAFVYVKKFRMQDDN